MEKSVDRSRISVSMNILISINGSIESSKMLFLCSSVVNNIHSRIFLIESSTVVGQVNLTSPVTKKISHFFSFLSNQNSISAETTDLYLPITKFTYTGGTSVVVSDLMY